MSAEATMPAIPQAFDAFADLTDIRRYRSREPITVHAIEWTGLNEVDVRLFVGDANTSTPGFRKNWTEPGFTVIHSTVDEQFIAQVWNAGVAAWQPVPVGHLVVRGRTGSFFPLGPDEFAGFYEPDDGLSDKERADKAEQVTREHERVMYAALIDLTDGDHGDSESNLRDQLEGVTFADGWDGRESGTEWLERTDPANAAASGAAPAGRGQAGGEINGDLPARWVFVPGIGEIGGWVCAVPDPGRPDGICGNPVESEPCGQHETPGKVSL